MILSMGGYVEEQLISVKNKKILIVDDDTDMCMTLKNIFEMKNYEADIAENVDKAIALAERKTYDIFLVDFVMEKMNGIDLLGKLRQYSPGAVHSIMSAYIKDDRFDKETSENSENRVKIFAKPFDIDQMVEFFNQSTGQV